MIQILSAVVTAIILPGEPKYSGKKMDNKALTLPEALEQALRSISSVCGWVIIFRIVIDVGEKWIMHLLPEVSLRLLTGVLELANGCCNLSGLPAERTRFLLCAVYLSFGGLCVLMQTASAVKELGLGQYFPGKLMQTMVSFLLAQLCLPFLFPDECLTVSPLWSTLCVGCLGTMGLLLKFRENTSRNQATAIV